MGKLNPIMSLTELSLSDIRTMFPDDLIRQLDEVHICGTYGDAMVANDTLAIFEHFRSLNPLMQLRLYTNGSGRTADWWQRLAQLRVLVIFAIDGLADTNHLYRRRTVWPKIMESVKAFIGAGGHAVWHFIVFRHNEHQVDEALALSRELGFEVFQIKKSERYGMGESWPVHDEDGSLLYQLQIPLSPQYRNGGFEARHHRVQDRTYGEFLESVTISCRAVNKRRIFVTAEGVVVPCCWTDPRQGDIDNLLAALPEGKSSLDARRFPLRDIVEGPLFRALSEGWNHPASQAGTQVCAQKCAASPDNMHLPENRAIYIRHPNYTDLRSPRAIARLEASPPGCSGK
jgi:MoaA/NifB/PqqE/SkfB family radical SAM enzyme